MRVMGGVMWCFAESANPRRHINEVLGRTDEELTVLSLERLTVST
jgi:hypothetical protein